VDEPTDPLTAAVARQAIDLHRRVEELQHAAASDGLSTTDRARVLLALADATDALDQMLDRLDVPAGVLEDPTA